MAGLDENGFTTKRLPELVDDAKAQAVTTFQDLVSPGDTVNTDDSSVIGRLIALKAPAEADLWEAAQQVYSAFDANSATGISLDNMILLSGIPARFENTRTTAQVLLTGDNSTTIVAGNVVSSPTTSAQYSVVNDISLTPINAQSVVIGVISLGSISYSLSFTRQSVTQVVTYTASPSDTSQTILLGVKSLIDSTYPELSTKIQSDGNLYVESVDKFFPTTFNVSNNLGILKVTKLGDIVAIDAGPIDQPANTITKIQTSRLGWDSVTNPIAAVPGRFRETDEQLRLRFRNTKFDRSGNIVEAVYSALFSLDNVEQVFIDDNDTNVTNDNGTPPHSFLVLVDGGTSTEIARAIWDNRGAGVKSIGNTTVTITDKFGYQRDINFSRPTSINIYIQIDLTTNQNFPENGEDLIRSAIINYVDSLAIGQDVIYSRLYTPINSVPGHQVNSLLIGTTNPPTGMSNIILNFDQIGQVLPENITFV